MPPFCRPVARMTSDIEEPKYPWRLKSCAARSRIIARVCCPLPIVTSSPISGFVHGGSAGSRDLGRRNIPPFELTRPYEGQLSQALCLPRRAVDLAEAASRRAARNTSGGEKTDRSEREHSGTPQGLSRGTCRGAGASPVRLARRLLTVVAW